MLFAILARRLSHVFLSLTLMLLGLSLTLTRPAAASPSSLTYLGQLLVAGAPVTGSYDFQFKLYDAATAGNQVGATVSLSSVPVASGVYYATLYFGTGVIIGQNLWLQISYRVHPNSGNPAYTTLSPRNLAPIAASADYAILSGSTAALQGKAISTTAPTTGQVLTWSGSLWAPATPSGGGGGSYTAGTGLTLSGSQFSVTTGGITNSLLANGAVSGAKLALPLSASVSSSSDLFTLTNTGSGRAIVGNSSTNTAVKGVGYNGVYGSGKNYGVQADGTKYGVYSTSPAVGVYGAGSGSSGVGVQGSGGSTGVSGSGSTYGLYGSASNSDSSTNYGVYGSGTSYGVYGTANNYGVYGSGVYGIYGSGTSYGVYGTSTDSDGVYGNGYYGVYGTGTLLGLYGYGGTYGVYGYSNDIGVYGSGGNYAGYFNGNVTVTGTLTAGAKNFKIDHPLDPAHQYLSHASIESDQMLDLYSGHVTLDAAGAATVTMPSWFQALNTEFEYHLTPLGAPSPNLYIAQEVQDNKFEIAGGTPGLKVSWQVTGVRHDAFALAHPLQVEEDKPKEEQGTYLHPKELGRPVSQGLDFQRGQALPRRLPNPPPVSAAPQ